MMPSTNPAQEGESLIEVVQARWISTVQAEPSGRERLQSAMYRVGNQTQPQFTVNVHASISPAKVGKHFR
jgi:hypothetical protein